MTRRIRVLASLLPALVAVSCSKSTDVPPAPDTCGANPPRILSALVTQRGTPTSRADLGVPVTITIAAEDPDVACSDTVASYAWSFVSAPAGSTTGLPAGARGPAITITPDLAGAFQFRAVAVDAHGNDSEPVVVTVPTGPCGPTLTGISATPAFTVVGSAVALASLPAAPTSACVAGGALSLRWTLVSRPAGSGAMISAPGAASPSLVPDVPGTYLVELVVTDAGGFSSVAQQVIEAGRCAIAPTVGAVAVTATDPQGGAVTGGIVHRGDLVALSAPVTPGACDLAPVISYAWTLLSRPDGSAAILGGANTAAPYFVADAAAGSWELMVVARDASGNVSAPAFVTVSTSDCGARPPLVAVTAPPAVNAYTPTAVTVSVTDAEQLAPACPPRFANLSGAWTLAWSIALAPAGAHPELVSPGGPAATFQSDVPGSYSVRVTATGVDGVTGTGIAPVTVGACGSQAPVVSSLSWIQPTSGGVIAAPGPAARGSPATFTATVSDPDLLCGMPQPLTYAWRILSQPVGSAATLVGATTTDPNLTPDVVGTWTVEVVVTDPQGHAAVAQQTLTAN